MSKARADLNFGGALDGLKPEDWKPTPKVAEMGPGRTATVQAVARAAGYQSREPNAGTVLGEGTRSHTRRVFRTGRREQLNIKVREIDLTMFYRLCDEQNWVQGYAFQRALEALQRELQGETMPSHPVSA